MPEQKRIRVLVVDDSVVYREMISKLLSSDPMIEVVAKSPDAFAAWRDIKTHLPDVVTCDVEMPGMSGIEFVRRLIPAHPLPVIVVSSVSEAVLDAMNAGALDFVVKPESNGAGRLEAFGKELIEKVKAAPNARISPARPQVSAAATVERLARREAAGRIIAIGASTGGTDAVFKMLRELPPTIPGIVIVQHIPPVFSKMFADRLNDQTQLRVSEAKTGDTLEPGRVLVAPGDRHMRLIRMGGRYTVECQGTDKVSGHCPSVDVLFESVASAAGSSGIGVILTGMGQDGARGLLSMRKAGARTLGQDEASSVVYGMPKVAYEIGAVEKQAPLEAMPALLMSLLKP